MVLKLTLKPHEKAVINGAVIANGDRRTNITIKNRANVLRESDIIQADEANTPAKRIYLPVMLMVMGQGRSDDLFNEFEFRLTQFVGAVGDAQTLEICLSLAARVANKEFYKALTLCRKLMVFEESRLRHVA